MKKFKQALSGILVLLMMLTSLTIMPAVSAEEVATVILDEDCSDAPVGLRSDEPDDTDDNTATAGEWQVIGTGNPNYDVMVAPVKTADSTGMTLQHSRVDETNAQMYAVRKLTQDPSAANLTEGVYEISFDITPSTDSWLSVSIIDTNDPALLSAWNTEHTRNMIINLVNNSSTFKENSAATGWKTIYTDDQMPAGIGHIVQVQAHKNVWSGSTVGTPAMYWVMGTVDETKPVAVKAVVNMGTGKMSTYIYQDGELVASNSDVALSENIKANGLGYIVFGNAHGDTKISNLKVTKLEGYESRFFGVAEGFDNNEMFDGNAVQIPAKQKGWSTIANVPVSDSVTEATTTTIDTTKFDSNVMKIDDPNQMNGARMLLNTVGGETLKGSYKISSKMFVESGEVFMEIAHSSYSNRLVQIRLDSVDKVTRHYDSGPDGGNACLSQNKGTAVGTIDPTQWCDIELIIDVPEGKYGYTVSQNGAVVASASDQTLNEWITQYGFDFIQFRGLNTSSAADDWARHYPTYYIDDIKIEEYEYVYVEPEFENLDENFDNWTTVPNTWVTPNSAYGISTLETIEGTTNKVLSVSPTSENWSNGIMYVFSKKITDGTLNVSYDIKAKKAAGSDGAVAQVLWVGLEATAEGKPAGIEIPNLNNLYAQTNRNLTGEDKNGNKVELGTLDEDTWYTISVSARPADSLFDITITNREDGEVFVKKTDLPMEDEAGNLQTSAEALRFRTWVGENLIDNVKIEHIKQKPELSNSSIKMYDAFGTQTPSITSNVTPALGRIELDFATAMEDASGITLTGTNAPAITAVIDEDETNKVTITPSGMLASGATYTLTVPGTVTAANGETMGGDGFVLEFTTGTAETGADMTGVTVDGTPITTFAELSAKAGSKAVINTNAVNISNAPMELTYVVAYYDGSKCLGVTSIEAPDVAANNVLKTKPEFTIDVPTGATRAKIFLWTTLNNMTPYCVPLEF